MIIAISDLCPLVQLLEVDLFDVLLSAASLVTFC